jgi:Na+-driven multidrug efflux pump
LPQIIGLFGSTPVLEPYALNYGYIILAGIPFMIVGTTLNSIIRADGSPQYAMFTMVFGAVLNIILDYILMYQFNMGVQGAAIATFVSYFAIFVIRAINVQKYIPFKLYMPHVLLNTAVILLQSAFMVFSLPFNIPVQVVCAVLLMIINYKFIMVFAYKFLSFFKVKRRVK